jgi:peptide-methionine (S)-S-oxide reductase
MSTYPQRFSVLLLPLALTLWAGPAAAGSETAVVAGGCFWGVQAVFEHMKGVTRAVSGYAGGSPDTANYETVSSGRTGHAEAVEVTFDPAVVDYGTILRVYFLVAHDPTQLDRQGPDVGPQYRSALFVHDDAQQRVAEATMAALGASGAVAGPIVTRPIVTRIDRLTAFYPAEAYHQDFATRHPQHPYIVINDRPKVENLKRLFPDLYRENPVTALN